jgi:hypothetical protein
MPRDGISLPKVPPPLSLQTAKEKRRAATGASIPIKANALLLRTGGNKNARFLAFGSK